MLGLTSSLSLAVAFQNPGIGWLAIPAPVQEHLPFPRPVILLPGVTAPVFVAVVDFSSIAFVDIDHGFGAALDPASAKPGSVQDHLAADIRRNVFPRDVAVIPRELDPAFESFDQLAAISFASGFAAQFSETSISSDCSGFSCSPLRQMYNPLYICEFQAASEDNSRSPPRRPLRG